MTAWLRLALAAQLACFGVWGASLLAAHDPARDDVAVVWLGTTPVDPRDLLGGQYVALRYPISGAADAGCHDLAARARPTPVWVLLAPSGAVARTAEGTVAIWHGVACRETPPEPVPGERWIAGRLGAPRARDEIVYGIERFYVPEDSALRRARSGRVVAKVAIAPDFVPRLVDLVPILRETAPPPA